MKNGKNRSCKRTLKTDRVSRNMRCLKSKKVKKGIHIDVNRKPGIGIGKRVPDVESATV